MSLSSNILAGLSLGSVIVIAIVVTIIINNATVDYNNKLQGLVKEINDKQSLEYDFDKRQQQQLDGIQNNVSDMRRNYLPRDLLKGRVDSEFVYGNNVKADNVNINGGVISFDSKVMGANTNANFNIGRGVGDKKDNIVVTTPATSGAGVSFMSSGGDDILSINSLDKSVSVPSGLNVGKLSIKGAEINFTDNKFKMTTDSSIDGKLEVNGGLFIKDKAVANSLDVLGKLSIQGAVSTYNLDNLKTQFPNAQDGQTNIVAGDTEVVGSITTDGNATFKKDADVSGKLSIIDGQVSKTLKVGHNYAGVLNSTPFSVVANDAGYGASFGSLDNIWSHFPYTDGSTYIRPGKNNKDVIIGDMSTANIKIGDSNNATTVQGRFCIQDTCLTKAQLASIKTNAGV